MVEIFVFVLIQLLSYRLFIHVNSSLFHLCNLTEQLLTSVCYFDFF